MAFEDFGHLSDRRKAERQQKLKKRIAIAAISSFVLVLLVTAALVAVFYPSKNGTDIPGAAGVENDGRLPDVLSSTKPITSTARAVAMMCEPTDYKLACEKSLSKAVNRSTSPTPKDLVSAAIAVIMDEVDQAINRSSKLNSTDPRARAAVGDCRELLGYAMDDLETTLSTVDGHRIGNLPGVADDLKTWLSAAITYQETCIDGFPAGELKDKMRAAMTDAMELSSNALAIVDEVVSLFRMLQIGSETFGRRLKESHDDDDEHALLVKDRAPAWMIDDDRRLLKEHLKGNLKPNVVVAKDRSGNYNTINEALENLPKDRKGRSVYVIARICMLHFLLCVF